MTRVRITDVAPRDGLQNEPRAIPITDKVRLVDALSATRVDEIEVSSFVSPAWIPQLGDAAAVFAGMSPAPGITYSALVPNQRGLESALGVRQATRDRVARALPDKLSVFTAASQTFTRRNINATIQESIERFRPIAAACRAEAIPLRAYISCVIDCPFEGPITPDQVAEVIGPLLALGVDEIDLGDTIGAATPDTLARLLDRVLPLLPARDPFLPRGPILTLHLHDTYGAAGSCVARALEMGVRSFDSAAGGLGGCPYASTPGLRAPGNISTSSLLNVITRAGFTSGVDAAAIVRASDLATRIARPAEPEVAP